MTRPALAPDEYEVYADLRWTVVARVAVEDVGNHPNERREEVVREVWIEDENGRRLRGLEAAIAAARKVMDAELERRVG